MAEVKRERVLLYAFDASSLSNSSANSARTNSHFSKTQNRQNRKKLTEKLECFTHELQLRKYDKTFHRITDDHYLGAKTPAKYNCTEDETRYLTAWCEFQKIYAKKHGKWDISRPLYVDDWTSQQEMHEKLHILNRNRRQTEHSFENLPSWKQGYLKFNAEFYERNREICDEWVKKFEVKSFPKARRIFEWQAGGEHATLDECLIQFRQSGIRVKRPNYIPALVAINQTSILGKQISSNKKYRKLTPRECARMQAFPDNYDFGVQIDAATYKQLGNAVNVNVIYYAFREFTSHFTDEIAKTHPEFSETLQSIANSEQNPDLIKWKSKK